MSATIRAIYEHGVFRPLDAVAFSDNEYLVLHCETQDVEPLPTRLVPGTYLDDAELPSAADDYYRPIPPKVIGRVEAPVISAGRLRPQPTPDE